MRRGKVRGGGEVEFGGVSRLHAPVMTAEMCDVLHPGQSSESIRGWKKTAT